MSRSTFFASAGAGAAVGAAIVGFPNIVRAAGKLERVGVDYAYYNDPSLILKEFGWLEQRLAPQGIKVDWVLSLGSNKANQYLQNAAVDFGSTAGSAAFLARANGSPIRTVFLYSQPEWTALVVGKNSKITAVNQLKGKTIAATRGTDPWFFMLRSLRDAGLAPTDVNIVDLQHPDGRIALERGQVDAWAGLDPHMAASQLQAGSRLLYRNVAYNTYGALNIREAFLRDHPDIAAIVLEQYQRARKFAIANKQKEIEILAKASGTPIEVAALVVHERIKYPDPIPGPPYVRAVGVCEGIIRDDKLVPPGTDLDVALHQLVDPSVARIALQHA
ncbi:MAG: aliphatic sulfonate ABC transporter substrate-binding protein [Candidatus Eremiobacteraeota bacterium]|nr:aliphatic sulfonate ABC transporter substrate-binding protein [Candidatus Eremiobacteraeota bacterium]